MLVTVSIFDPDGNATPKRAIQGALTELSQPRRLFVAPVLVFEQCRGPDAASRLAGAACSCRASAT